MWMSFEYQLWQVGIVVGEISRRQMCSVHERTQKHTQTQEERPLGKMLRGLMKLHLIRFALWSLQSRDEGVDKDRARRLRRQGRRHGFERVGDIRQDFKDESKQQRNERWEGEWVR